MNHLTCRELQDFLADYINCDLPPAVLAAFETHLRLCPCCVNYLDSYRQTIALSREALCNEQAPLPPVPPQLKAAILAARKQGELPPDESQTGSTGN